MYRPRQRWRPTARIRAEEAVIFRTLVLLCTTVFGAAVQAADPTNASIEQLAELLATRRNVLLGEVHDNAEQHALRLRALQRRLEAGERPALAFEQLDRERQTDIDRIRKQQPRDAAAIAALGGPAWNWKFYTPFLQLALDYGLPIVAANLSRADAMRVSSDGWNALFDAAERERLGVERLPANLVESHERAVALGHCGLLPPAVVAALARAQIARDIVIARAIEPYLSSGVVLLSGNGHVRRDIGVPIWIAPEQRRALLSIGLLERDGDTAPQALNDEYDAIVLTAAAERPDPCEPLRRRLAPRPERAAQDDDAAATSGRR
jgi:uncharacterized iron-regulated protein